MIFFLKMKSWQLFSLFMILLVVTPEIVASSDFPEKSFAILNFIFVSLYLGWIWAAIHGARKQLPEEIMRSSPLGVDISIIYIICYMISLIFMSEDASVSSWLILLHLLAVGFLFYLFFYAAKTITQINLSEEVSFGEYLPIAFAFWFFPIGVWFIQPKLNRIYIGMK